METTRKYSKSERTKLYIIEKVAPIFNEKGFAGTSLSDMTEATGLTKGAIYGNFKNKDEIAIEAFNYNYSILANVFNEELACVTDPLERLKKLPDIYLSMYPKIASMGGCPILNTIVDSDDSHELLKDVSSKTLLGLKKVIEDILTDCINSNRIDKNTDVDKLSALFITLIEGGFLVAKTMNNQSYFECSTKQMENIIDSISIPNH